MIACESRSPGQRSASVMARYAVAVGLTIGPSLVSSEWWSGRRCLSKERIDGPVDQVDPSPATRVVRDLL